MSGVADRGDSRHLMTSSVTTRVLGWVGLASMAVMALLGLVISPRDRIQGEAVRLLYIHVPTIWVAYGSFILTAVASALYLWRGSSREDRGRHYDRIAGAAGEVAVLFLALTLVTGMLWGRITWGVFWQWDARLTTTALMFVSYLGYLAIRNMPADIEARSKRAAIAALLAAVNIPIVHFSVEWWRTLHQKASIRSDRNSEITGDMFATLMFSLLAFTVVAAWLMIHRYRLVRLEEIREEEGLALAVSARRAEGVNA